MKAVYLSIHIPVNTLEGDTMIQGYRCKILNINGYESYRERWCRHDFNCARCCDWLRSTVTLQCCRHFMPQGRKIVIEDGVFTQSILTVEFWSFVCRVRLADSHVQTVFQILPRHRNMWYVALQHVISQTFLTCHLSHHNMSLFPHLVWWFPVSQHIVMQTRLHSCITHSNMSWCKHGYMQYSAIDYIVMQTWWHLICCITTCRDANMMTCCMLH